MSENTLALTNAPDLTKKAPRSPRVRLGGYAILPRMLDKGRAALIGKLGEYKYNCNLDQFFVNFTGIDAEALKAQLALGKGDGEILDWINANAKTPRGPWEIAAWSRYHEERGADSVDKRVRFAEYLGTFTQTRADIHSWFDILDLDDYVSFGGKA
jgi:hypothetical protein